MLVKLGARAAGEDVPDLLLACHARIRKFTALAAKLATVRGAPASELRTAAADVRRYFGVALPLHVADEDHEITERLRGTSPQIDEALATLHGQHVAHEPLLARMIEICRAIEEDPARQLPLSTELGNIASELTAQFDEHLALEEKLIIPAIAALPEADRAAIRDAMRARRTN